MEEVNSATTAKSLCVSCGCGANHYTVLSRPLLRFLCHCHICQAYTGKPYADVTVVLSSDIRVGSLVSTRFKKWRLPPNIKRGTCIQCGTPVIEYGLMDKLAFVPKSHYKNDI